MSYTYPYPRPALTVDCIIFCKDINLYKVLLIQRDKSPFEAHWALPGGFVEIDETLENAALRELEEETGLGDVKLDQLYTFDAIDRDPRGRTISVVFTGFIESKRDHLKASSDARDVKWFFINKLPKLAFDHGKIIDFALRKLKL